MNESTSWDCWRLEGARILTAPGVAVQRADLQVEHGVITALAPHLPPPPPGTRRLARPGMLVAPGFVQAHLHLCQSLFRGLAEERRLARWLTERIWPLEAALTPDTLRASARIGLAEALLQGATTLLDMGPVHGTPVIAREVAASGMRAILGKALMDSGDGVPAALRQDPQDALAEACDLHDTWHGAAEGRLQIAFAPRFTLSVSAPLWQRLAREASARDTFVHTHVSETPWENETCRAIHGTSPVAALEQWGVLAAGAVLVHAVWLTDDDRALIARRRPGIVHCPGSNAKLGSGLVDLPGLLAAGVPVGLGSDGAACNDLLSPLAEMRLAAQLQNLRAEPGALPAVAAFDLATRQGARALRLGSITGELAVGRRADLLVYAATDLSWETDLPIEQALVYAGCGLRPREVYVDGRPRVLDGQLVDADEEALRREAAAARNEVLARIAKDGPAWRFPAN